MCSLSRSASRMMAAVATTVCWSMCLASPAAEQDPSLYRFTVFLEAPPPDPEISFGSAPQGIELKILSSHPVDISRPLLLIVDPSSYTRAEIRSRISYIGEALAVDSPNPEVALDLRVGIPVLDGVLSEPMTDRSTVKQELEKFLTSYIPETAESPQGNLERTFDLIAGMIRRSEADRGSLDCLILAKDRSFESAESDYLSLGAQRLLLEVCRRHGSTLHGLLEGGDSLKDVCLETGGMVFQAAESAETAIRHIYDARLLGYTVEAGWPETNAEDAQYGLPLQAMTSDGKPLPLRAPRAIWHHPAGLSAPDFYHMRLGLDWIGRAEDAEKDDNLTVASRFLLSALQEDPWNPQAYYLSGRVMAAMGDLPQAAEFLSRALRFPAPQDHLLLLYGKTLMQLGRSVEALTGIRTVVGSGRSETPALRLLTARLLFKAGKYEESRALYAATASEDNRDADIQAEYGRVLWKLGREAEAVHQYRLALSGNPDNAVALVGTADIELSHERYQEALESAQRSVLAHPRDPDSQAQMGAIHAARREWSQAIDFFKAALTLDPSRSDILHRLADAHTGAGRFEEAIEILQRAVGENPLDIGTQKKLAEVHARAGNLSMAAMTMEGAAARSSGEAPILYRRAAALRERLGENGQALLDYRAYLRSLSSESTPSSGKALARHLAYLSLSIDGADRLAEHPLNKDLGLEEEISRWVRKRPHDSASKAESAEAGLTIPGGFSVLASTLGIQVDMLRQQRSLEQIFFYILETAPKRSDKLKDNPIRRDMVAYLKNFSDLLNEMSKRQMLPAGFDAKKGHEFLFPVMGEKSAVAKTAQFLSFFGVGLKSKQAKTGDLNVTLTVKENQRSMERQRFLRALGVNILDRNLREIRFTLKDDEIPMIYGSDVWAGPILAKENSKSKYLLERMVLNPGAMILYIALADCSEETRQGLLKSMPAGKWLSMTDYLAPLARYLDFREGRLVFPGSGNAWEQFLNVAAASPAAPAAALLQRDRGKALLLYAVLSGAPQSIRQYFTVNSQRLGELYQMLPAFDDATLKTTIAGVTRVLQLVKADRDGLYLPLDARFGKYLPSGTSGVEKSDPGAGFRPVRLDNKGLSTIISLAREDHPLVLPSIVELLELLEYLQGIHPDMLSDASIAALMQEPGQIPVLLDLVLDIDPPADLLVDYLAYCRQLAKGKTDGWNVDRTRSSQAIFFLLSALRREEALTKEIGIKLLGEALTQFQAEEESPFARRVANFLSRSLLPALSGFAGATTAEPDPLLEALAGGARKQAFAFGGRPLQLDASAYKLRRMQGSIQHQQFTPLTQLLQIYDLIEKLAAAEPPSPDIVVALADAVSGLQSAQLPPGSSKTLRHFVAQADLEDLKSKVEEFRAKGGGNRDRTQLASRLGSALHTELGVTLLTLCYAYHGTPEIDVLAFDQNFVRKHQFYENSNAPGWPPARLNQRESMGSYLDGSLSGLSYQLYRLETSQAVQSFGKRDVLGLVPTLLSGMRAVRPALRSDRAQEYVALTVRLGRELIALMGLDERVNLWCRDYLDSRISPRRRESISSLVGQYDPKAAAQVLSPSELFFLGQVYLNVSAEGRSRPDSYVSAAPIPVSTGTPSALHNNEGPSEPEGAAWSFGSEDVAEYFPDIASPLKDRLREIVPQQGSTEADEFRREVEQYGILLHHRLGLRQLSFSLSDSYEQLEQNARSEIVLERICDLKIRVGELNYALGLPSSLGEVETELAIRDILPGTAEVRTGSWQLALEQIARLGPGNLSNWIEEMLNRGALSISEISAERKAPEGEP